MCNVFYVRNFDKCLSMNMRNHVVKRDSIHEICEYGDACIHIYSMDDSMDKSGRHV